jgi:outer membrane immunogenic protein
MRRVLMSLVAFAFAQSALAADYGEPVLRGSVYEPVAPNYLRWEGMYFGAQAGWTFNHTELNRGPLSTSLNDDMRASSYGGFFGYNMQWENAVLGVELNYNHTSLPFSTTGAGVGIDGTQAVRITDMGTLRGRAGWVFGTVMAYGLGGLAIARADLDSINGMTDSISYGWALGAGVDWAILPNVFVRLEYEHTGFSHMKDVRFTTDTVRGGVGVRF